MIGGILLLAIAVFGIQILFGTRKPENLFSLAVWLLFAPILLAIGYHHALWFWLGLPLWMQILSFSLIPFFVSAFLKFSFPKVRWVQDLQATVFQTLIYAVTFPFRFLWRAGRFLFQRERRPQRLNPYRPVVGGRPPLRTEHREANPRGNIFD